jgi:serine protease AprX
VISVGATNQNDELSFFSARGPSFKGTLKPDFSAPGVKIFSSSIQSNSSYVTRSGTSMAAPHVSGIVALIMSAHKKKNARLNGQKVFGSDRKLGYDDIYDILKRSSVSSNPAPIDGGGYTRYPPKKIEECGGFNHTVSPNNFYGFGRVDALKAVELTLDY